MDSSLHDTLSRRERQIIDVVYRLGEATVAEVVDQIPDSPGYHPIRVAMANLEEKGYLQHRREGKRYVFSPVIPEEKAKRSELGHLLRTFFAGSPSQAILTLLDMSSGDLSDDDLEEIRTWIEQAKTRSE